jgi:hypothetical protein
VDQTPERAAAIARFDNAFWTAMRAANARFYRPEDGPPSRWSLIEAEQKYLPILGINAAARQRGRPLSSEKPFSECLTIHPMVSVDVLQL